MEGIVFDKTKELEESARRLRHALTFKTNFFSMMTHELRTPLNGVLASSSLLIDDKELSEESHELARIINSSSESLLSIINDVLDLSKMESGKLKIELIECDLGSVAEDVRKLLKFESDKKGLDFKLSIKPDVPTLVKGDPSRIRQILLNLLGNAIKFTESGKVSLTVQVVKVVSERYKLEFVIEDTGVGLTEQQSKTIFDGFVQADASVSRKYGGTGLGLSICKKLIDLMGGEIQVESTEGVGSVFKVLLPLEKIEYSTSSLASSKQGLNQEKVDLKRNYGIHVLLAEDNMVNQIVAKKHFERLGIKVTLANDGREALALYESSPNFDMIILDIRMPIMSGVEVLLELKKRDCKLPILSMSANVIQGDLVEYKRLGFSACLQKPIVKSDLIAVFDKYTAK